MLADPGAFDPENGIILRYIFKTGATGFVEIEFDRESATWDATRTSDNAFYEVVETVILEGKSAARTKKIRNMIENCDLVCHTIMADRTERVTGVEYDGEVFGRPFQRNRIIRHQDNAGQAAGDNARDELDFGGRVQYAPLYANVGTQQMRDNLLPQGVQAFGSGNDVYGKDDNGDGIYGAYGPNEVRAQQEGQPNEVTTATEEVDATEAAKTLAEERGLDLHQVCGTGQEGRILKADVKKIDDEK
jgi:pyruvate/2-oxoglutarate dehydrogenase complex dihydrolipoamide acyltransferase (E2) component